MRHQLSVGDGSSVWSGQGDPSPTHSSGAVYQAAGLSKLFRVKKFIVKDSNVYPVQVWLCIQH